MFLAKLHISIVLYYCSRSGNNSIIENNIHIGEPVITFDTVFYNFGTVKHGEKVTYSYTYTNTGESDLVITNVLPSCGCTVPKYDKNPISPGSTSSIDVVFDTQGRSGSQFKSVKIYSNAMNSKITLTFKANIISK